MADFPVCRFLKQKAVSVVYFLELQVRVSGAGACNIEDEWVSSELDEDDSSLTEELSGFADDEEFPGFTDEEESSDFMEEELFSEDSF